MPAGVTSVTAAALVLMALAIWHPGVGGARAIRRAVEGSARAVVVDVAAWRWSRRPLRYGRPPYRCYGIALAPGVSGRRVLVGRAWLQQHTSTTAGSGGGKSMKAAFEADQAIRSGAGIVASVAAVVEREQLPEAMALTRDLTYFGKMHRAERFIGHTTVAWDFRPEVVAYSFAHVPKDLRPLYYTIVFEAIDDYVRTRPQWPPLIACIDELRYMAQVAGLMDFVRHATRTWRNKGAGLWAADQNPGTWFGDGMAGAGQMTANNTRFKWFGQLDPDDIRVVMERFGDVLTADDEVLLRTAGRGDAVMIFDTEPVRLHVGLTARETEYFVRRARDDQNGSADDAQ